MAVAFEPAIAEYNAREVLLGVSRVGAGADRAPGSKAREESDAERLYADAREDLAGGHTAAGQRLLEVLIARHPDTAAAARARHDIVALYAGSASARDAVRGQDQRSTLGAGRPAGELASPAAGSPVTASTPPAVPAAIIDGWRAKVQPAPPSAQESLRATAGDRVFFSEGSADLGLKARSVLAAQAAWLKSRAFAAIVIEGHADEPGTEAANRDLAAKRAEIVRSRLIDEGIDADRIAVAGFGRARPVAECGEALCSAQNRRAVTVVMEAASTGGVGELARGTAGTPR